MPPTRSEETLTEAIDVFDDASSLQEAIDVAIQPFFDHFQHLAPDQGRPDAEWAL